MNPAGRFGVGLRSAAIFSLNRFVNLLPMDRDRLRGFNPQPHLVAADVNDRHDHIVADHDAFVSMSRKDQHGSLVQCSIVVGTVKPNVATPTLDRMGLPIDSGDDLDNGSIGNDSRKSTTIRQS